MALARLLGYAEHLRTLLQDVPPPEDAAERVMFSCKATEAEAAVEELLTQAEPLDEAGVQQLSRLLVDHSRVLQDYGERRAAADAGGPWRAMQNMAMQAQAAAATTLAIGLMQLGIKAQLPGSVAYRLAATASSAIFHQGASGNSWHLRAAESKPDDWKYLAGPIANLQCTTLACLSDWLGRAAGGPQLQQLFGRTAMATPAAEEWLASAAETMCAVCQQGAIVLEHHVVFATFCEQVLRHDSSSFEGLREVAECNPEVQAALGFALAAGLAAQLRAMGAGSEAAAEERAAEHVSAAATSLMAGALQPLWTAAGSSGSTALQQQAATQVVEAAQAALQLAVAQPWPLTGAQSFDARAHLVQLLLLPHAAALLASGGTDCFFMTGDCGAHARHAMLRAAPSAAAALRTTTQAPEDLRFLGPGLHVWCTAVQTVVRGPWRQQQSAELQPLLQDALAAAEVLLRLLPLVDGQLRPLRQTMQLDARRGLEEELAHACSAAIGMLEIVAGWAASWADAVPAAESTPALRQQLWQLLATAAKVACAAADAWAAGRAAKAGEAAEGSGAATGVSADERAAAPDSSTAGAADDQPGSAAAGAASDTVSGSLLVDCMAAGLDSFSAAAASLQRTADSLWAASGAADAGSWRDAHVLALLQLQASLALLLHSPARLPPQEQHVPCGESFAIAQTLLDCATLDEQLFTARPEPAAALMIAVEDALLQPSPAGASGGEASALREDASPGMTSALLAQLAHAVVRQPRLAPALLQCCLHSPVITAASLALERDDKPLALECQLVCMALERSVKESLQAALQRHGAEVSGRSGSGSGNEGSRGSSGGGGASSSAGRPGGSSSSGSNADELHAALAAAKQAAASMRLLEEGGEFGESHRESNFEALFSVAAHLQRVWQLEQPPEERQAPGLRLAAAAALRGCANLRCTDLAGASEAECRGRKCSGCKTLRFCDAACQKADWQEGGHRHVCRLLAQRRAHQLQQAGEQQQQRAAAGGGPET